MWTVLLVEDEVLVRESIKAIIPWEELGFTVVAEAGDGVQAMDAIRKHVPDLVITDIIMPFMNGVEVLKQARSEGFDARFVVLSCMSDFEYVREAMEYGASNYILKLSMSLDALKEALEKVRVELLQSISSKHALLDQYYERIWRYIGEDIVPQQSAEHIQFPVSTYASLHFFIVSILHGSSDMDKKLFLRQKAFTQAQPETVHMFHKWGHTTFICGYTNEQQALHTLAQWRNEECADFALAYSPLTSIDTFCATWASVLQALNRYWYEGDSGMQFAEAQPVEAQLAGTEHRESSGIENESATKLWALERLIIQQYEQMKTTACQTSVQHLFELMEEQRVPMYTVKATALRLGETFSRMMNTPFDWQDDMTKSVSHAQLLQTMQANINTKLEQWERRYIPLSDHPEINKVIDYIRVNYNQDLTVKSLAKYVSLDEKYLSRLFKIKTGESLIHYLQRVRIRKAEYYLKTTDLSVSEIGTMVGFNNDNYFIKIFRRWNEQTPSQYRKSTQ